MSGYDSLDVGEEHGRRIDALNRAQDSLELSTDHALSSLRSKLSGIEETVEGLEERERGTTRRFESLEADLEEARDTAQVRSEELEESISATDTGLERLTTRVSALERHLRQAEGAVVIDLDHDRDGKLSGLGRLVEEGLAAEEGLFSDHQRDVHQHRITTGRQAKQALTGLRSAVRDAAAVLATTPAGDPRRRKAEQAFPQATAEALKQGLQIGRLAQSARASEAELAADNARRTASREAIDTGQRAHTQLRVRLRSRLTEALTGTGLLPVWFTTALGPMAPSRASEGWLETALDVLVYRVTYRVTDPVLALGSTPHGGHSPRRTARFNELKQSLRNWG
ncbi:MULTISPECIES: CopG family transcriptional regulator [unclassified Streptomyces]|uniref:CopG family transcriptional regulator n=1 Tax=unclassified Streptomyces TaxID=2593676 RepID=UPI00344F7E6F